MGKEYNDLIELKDTLNGIKGNIEAFKNTSNFERSKDAKIIIPEIERACEILCNIDFEKLKEALATSEDEKKVKNTEIENYIDSKLDEKLNKFMEDVSKKIDAAQVIDADDLVKIDELTNKVNELSGLKQENEKNKEIIAEKDIELETLKKEIEPVKNAKGLKKAVLKILKI